MTFVLRAARPDDLEPLYAMAKSTGGGAVPPPPPAKKGKLSYKDQRDYEILPARIEALDAEIARTEAALADGALYTANPAKFAQLTAALDKARAEKDAAEERWLELAEQVESA